MNASILVIEDEPDISALVAYHLARASYRVRTAGDGPEAMSALGAELPDLVILDLMLERPACGFRRRYSSPMDGYWYEVAGEKVSFTVRALSQR